MNSVKILQWNDSVEIVATRDIKLSTEEDLRVLIDQEETHEELEKIFKFLGVDVVTYEDAY